MSNLLEWHIHISRADTVIRVTFTKNGQEGIKTRELTATAFTSPAGKVEDGEL